MKTVFLTLATLVLAAGSFTYVEYMTHAMKISRITGTPYFQVLDAWHRLEHSGKTDSDTAEFDQTVGLADDCPENAPADQCESTQN